jgi:DNA-binding MarR family transcriptional regulator
VLRQVAGEKLTYSQLKLLYLVAHTAGFNIIGDAARFLKISNAAASKAVDKLVRRRLLRRSEKEADRRVSQLSLTETGRKLLETYETARNERAEKIFAQFSQEELHQTSALLERLAAAIVLSSPVAEEMCMQCEIYYRDTCKFAENTQRTCFYQRLKCAREDRLVTLVGGPEIRKET